MLSSVKGRWAIVLGSSSGFGEAISLRLSEMGLNIVGVHLDRKATLPHVDQIVQQIRNNGSEARFFNMNAADSVRRQEALDEIKTFTNGVHCLVHSLAFGSLKPFISEDAKDRLSKDQMEMTLDVMAHSLVYWVQDLVERSLLKDGARIFAMTSSGGTRVWPTYGAVSAAKAALESHCRQLALELAPRQIAVNAVRAGVTDTPALRKIPGNEQMVQFARERNPAKRITTPRDIANIIALLVHDEARWLTGDVLGVDGGEDIVG